MKHYPTCGFKNLQRFPHISCILSPNHFQWTPGLSPPTTPQLANGFGKMKKHVTPNCQHICLGIPASKFTFFCASKSAGSSKWTLFGFGILATQSLFVNPPWEKTSQQHPCDTLTEQLSPFVLSWHCWKGLEKCISVFEILVILECFRCQCLRYCWEQVGANNSMLSVFRAAFLMNLYLDRNRWLLPLARYRDSLAQSQLK